jgi:hypothetical protein
MSKIVCSIFLFFSLSLNSFGQNLLLNGSFESYSTCPPAIVTACNNWSNPNPSSPDFFHSCAPTMSAYSTPWNFAGNQVPFDSSGYVGLFFFDKLNPNTREYVTGQLSSPFIAGNKYYVSYMANLATSFGYSIRTLGAYFTTTQPSVSNYDYWQVEPQIENTAGNINDSVSWIQIADTFTATGGEQFITIGNFRPDSLSDTLNLYAGPYYYYSAYYYVDAVKVMPYDPSGVEDLENQQEINIFPNPAKNSIAISFQGLKNALSDLFIYNSLGELVLQKSFSQGLSEVSYQLDISDLVNGIYFLKVQSSGGFLHKKFVKQ